MKKGNSPPAWAGYGHEGRGYSQVRAIMENKTDLKKKGSAGGKVKAERAAAKLAAWNAMNPERAAGGPRPRQRTRSLQGDGVWAEEMERLSKVIQAVTRKHAGVE